MNNKEAQEYAIRQYHKKLWDYVKPYQQYIGKTVRGVKTTASGLLAAAHLVGSGRMKDYFDESKPVPKDGNGMPASTYMKDMGNYNLNNLLGYDPD